MKHIRLVKKSIVYILGLFVLALGIAFSVKANLGVSPVSSVPFVLSRMTGLSLGMATVIVYLICMALQAAVLRRDYRLTNLLQIAVSFLFGFFTDAAVRLTSLLPVTENFIVRAAYLVFGVSCVALGVLLYMTTSFTALPTDGTVQAIAFKSGFRLYRVKIVNDCVYTAAALALSLAAFHGLKGLGIGTVIASFGVGRMLGLFTALLKKRLLRFLNSGAPGYQLPTAA
jgi:uncharacterized membrane protein YczE